MQKIKEGVEGFDISMLLKSITLKLNKLDKTKNILIKELQSLKSYSMDKADRAFHNAKQSDVDLIKSIIH